MGKEVVVREGATSLLPHLSEVRESRARRD
jgi:hypothetical protein